MEQQQVFALREEVLIIKAYVGNIGSGKTVSATKFILSRCQRQHSFVNYAINAPNTTRLLQSHIVHPIMVGEKKDGTPIHEYRINWDFWKEQLELKQGFNIIGDEWHNVMHSRASMTKWNILLSKWMSQIRKIMGSSEQHDFVFVTQRLDRVDVSARDLLDEIIYCQKILLPQKVRTPVLFKGRQAFRLVDRTVIRRWHFKGEQCVEKYQQFYHDRRAKTYDSKTAFLANPFMKYYDSYQFVTFGTESEYL